MVIRQDAQEILTTLAALDFAVVTNVRRARRYRQNQAIINPEYHLYIL